MDEMFVRKHNKENNNGQLLLYLDTTMKKCFDYPVTFVLYFEKMQGIKNINTIIANKKRSKE